MTQSSTYLRVLSYLIATSSYNHLELAKLAPMAHSRDQALVLWDNVILSYIAAKMDGSKDGAQQLLCTR